jgi:hypothetical protein
VTRRIVRRNNLESFRETSRHLPLAAWRLLAVFAEKRLGSFRSREDFHKSLPSPFDLFEECSRGDPVERRKLNGLLAKLVFASFTFATPFES